MWVVLKYSDFGAQKTGPSLSHVAAIGPFETQDEAVEHARAMKLLASERWFYSVCNLIMPNNREITT